MYRLRTLGGLSLDGERGALVRTGTPRKTLALLALVAAAGESGISRDRLLAHLWPESDTERARGALRQMLHALRRQLGEATPLLGGSVLRFDTSVVTVDVVLFEAAIRHGDLAAAVGLYAGPFLDGFHLDGAPDFERWVDTERARLAARHAAALEQLARQAAADRDHATAAMRWRELAAIEPLNGRVAIGLAQALAASGDRAGALERLAIHSAHLAADVDTTPDPAVVALAQQLRAVPATVPGEPRSGRTGPGPAPSDAAPIVVSVPSADVPAPKPTRGAVGRRPLGHPTRGVTLAAALLAVAALVGVGARGWRPRPSEPAERAVVAVLPFRVGGAEPGLRALREGMVDLLVARIGTDIGLRSVDAGSVLRAWRRAGGADTVDLTLEQDAAVATRLRAGRFLVGAVAGTATHLTLTATLFDVGTARSHARASVEGPVDSLPVLVDRLAASLLALDAGEGEGRLASLTSTSLPAVQAYLAGRGLNRRGQWLAAGDQFAKAVELDSTFVLAAFELMHARLRVGNGTQDIVRGERLAWAGRDRLNPVDRLRLERDLGRQYPSAPTMRDRIAIAEQLVAMAPEDAEAWDALAALYYLYGATIELPDWRERARRTFEEAFALDSSNLLILHRLPEIYAERGDTAALRRIVALARTLADSGRDDGGRSPTTLYRFLSAYHLGDSAETRRLRRRLFDSVPDTWYQLQALPDFGLLRAEDGDSVDALRLASARTEPERRQALSLSHAWQLERGRPLRAAAATQNLDSTATALADVQELVFWGGDRIVGARGARVLERAITNPRPSAPGATPPPNAAARLFREATILAEYRLANDDTLGARRLVERLRSLQPAADSAHLRELHDATILMLEAQLATANHRPEALALTARLDSVLRLGPRMLVRNWEYVPFYQMANLVSARLWEAHGDVPRALAATRRRIYRLWPSAFLSTYVREEARLAALAGDRAGAIRAYRHYVALRSDPEPAQRADLAAARAVLARLEGTPHPAGGR